MIAGIAVMQQPRRHGLMRLRPATAADDQAATELIIAVDVDQIGEADYSLDALHDEWSEVGFELAKDAVVVEDADGRRSATRTSAARDLIAVVDPRREGEGVGTALLEWAERRAREKGLHTLRQAVGDRGTTARAFLEAAGWKPVRSFWRMERDVSPADPEPSDLRPVAESDAPALYAIHEAAFARVGGYTPTTEDVWTQREFGNHGFDAALGRVAERDGAPVGFALARRWEDGVVYVPLLAVHPDAAGRGLGGHAADRRLRRRGRRRPAPGPAQRRRRQPRRGAPVRARGDVSTLARRRLPEAAARLGAAMGAIPINIADHVGRTPMVQLARLTPEGGGQVFGKLEMFNPGGSVKDRIGVAMIEAAEQEGRIEPGRTTIVEATSGNTGIALAFVCAAKGYELILTLPQGMSREREGLLRLYGAQVHITESMGGMNEAVAAARAMARDHDVFLPDQFSNPANPDIHRRTTGPEMWEALDGKVDYLVAGVGTGGTITGTGSFLKERDKDVKVIAVEPATSAGAVRRASRAAQDPGHRRGLRAAGAAARPARRDHRRRRRGRDRDGAPRRAARGRAVRHLVRRGAVGGARDRRAPGGEGQADRGRAARLRRALRVHTLLRARADSPVRMTSTLCSAPERLVPARPRGAVA